MYTDNVLSWNTFFSDLVDELYGESLGLNNKLKYFVDKTEDSYILEIAVPGYEKDDLILDLENNILSVSYEKPEKETSKWKNTFIKTFKIKQNITATNIDAKLEKGILSIKFPIGKDQKKKTLTIK